MKNIQRSLLPVFVFAKISIRRAFRDKTAMFFIFLFPLIFLFVFGGIFGKSSDISFKVAVINQSNTKFSSELTEELKKNAVFKVDQAVASTDAAKEKMSRGQLDATIVLPPGFGEVGAAAYPTGKANILYTQNSEQAARTLSSVLEGEFQALNASFVKAETPLTLSAEMLNTKSLSPFDYTFAGLLGFAIIGLGIFGPANAFPELKKQGVLRRLHTTPLRVWQFFVANALAQAVIGIVSLVMMFAVGIFVFDLKVAGNILELGLFLVFSIVMILGIGLALGGWAKNERQAAPLSNIIVFPMMFLSGTFFPRFLMPSWLQNVSDFLPLTPVIDGARLLATEGKHLVDLGPQLLMIGAWLIVVYILAFRVFRWE